ncbi:glycosyltransferase family 9 protein [Helicobacter pylori]|uniref:glycosyltransferase family 9 protein n=1 Tax=Helicobacter pylori TaxID=210 RepID=UPI00042755A9|nr:glycosyltransferase family 9 protein [Helicobacter pylori]
MDFVGFEDLRCKDKQNSQKVFVIRNDKLGDFILAIPALIALKHAFLEKGVEVYLGVVVPNYTTPIALEFPFIDEVIIEDNHLATTLKNRSIDALIFLFSNFKNAKLAFSLRKSIPYILAPKTKIYSWFYQKSVRQNRSLCLKTEYEYNLDLIHAFCKDYDLPNAQIKKIAWKLKDKSKERTIIASKLNANVDLLWIGVHMHSGGSSPVLPASHFIELIGFLHKNLNCEIILICGPGERNATEELLKEVPFAHLYDTSHSLVDLAKLCANLSVYIGNASGPLHVNALFDNQSIGFYPNELTASIARWRPFNERFLGITPPDGSNDMNLIDIKKESQRILEFIALNLSSRTQEKQPQQTPHKQP